MRVTEKMLKDKIAQINKALGNSIEPYTWKGKVRTAHIGTVMLEQAYGGNRIVKLLSDAGLQEPVIDSGFVTKPKLYESLCAYLKGIENGKKRIENGKT